MQATFFQKILICVVLSALAAGLIQWYKFFVAEGIEIRDATETRTVIP